MPKPFVAAVAAVCLFSAGPAAAQPPAAAEARPSADESLVFVGQLGEALNVQVAGMKKLLEARPLFDRMTTPAGVKAAAPEARALMAAARRSVQESDAMLARIVPPAAIRLGNLTAASMIADVRSQNAKSMALLADYEAFLAAAERGDRAGVLRAAPKLMEGSFLLIDGNATLYRGRQAAVPADKSIHQALGIGAQLYRAMGAAGRGWMAAKLGALRGEAVASMRMRLGEAAGEARALSRDGRANLARELGEFDRNTARAGFTGAAAAERAGVRQAFALKERMFVIGDELADLAEAGARADGAALAAQPNPELVGQLARLELRFHATVTEQAAAATGASR